MTTYEELVRTWKKEAQACEKVSLHHPTGQTVGHHDNLQESCFQCRESIRKLPHKEDSSPETFTQ